LHLVKAPLIGDGKSLETALRPSFAPDLQALPDFGTIADGVFYVIAEDKALADVKAAPGVVYVARLLPADATKEEIAASVQALAVAADAAIEASPPVSVKP
jgi:hypothetical protein